MSIKIAQDVSAPLVLTNFFASALARPFTICSFGKVLSVPSAGEYTSDVVRLGTSTNYATHKYGSTAGSPAASGSAKAGGGNYTALVSLGTGVIGQWVPCITSFVSGSHTVYGINESAAEVSTTSNTSPTPSNIVDATILGESWPSGDYYAAYIAVYTVELTAAQRAEFQTTGEVAGLTPYVKWDAAADWGAGTIADVSGNGRAITPPAGWTYSVDNPSLSAPTTTDYTLRKGSTFDVTHGLSTITTATLNAINVFDHVSSQAAGTVSFTGAVTDEITSSGEVALVLGDGATTETYVVQVNVYGVVPSNNPLQKDGAILANLTNVQVRITDGLSLNGAQIHYSATKPTDASGNFNPIDVSESSAVANDSVLMHVLTGDSDSIISPEIVGLI